MNGKAEELRAWAGLWGLLAEVYTYPLSREKLTLLSGLVSEDESLGRALAALRNALVDVTDWDRLAEELNVEYTRLFEGPGHVPAPPYASFYLNGGLLMGSETVAVRRTYLERNVAPVQMGRVPDDHIALELAFISHLSGEAHAALAQGNDARAQSSLEAQGRFLRDHLLTWLPRFREAVASATPRKFFEELANLTEGFAQMHAEFTLAHSSSDPRMPGTGRSP
ncbi:MAG: molecular chaperone TorD family protein [Actinobacteria bacterium]|nr:molecular chaperone TorD family protein [Actinomycetota bacterium]